jgi:hypothetical protein
LTKVLRTGRLEEEGIGEGVEERETVVNTGGPAVEVVVDMEVATVSAPSPIY